MADVQLSNGHLRIANALWDAWMQADLTKREWRVLMAVVRLSYGWRRSTTGDSASNASLARATGLDRKAVRIALKGLMMKQVVRRVRRGDESHRPAEYAPEKDPDAWSPMVLASDWRAHPLAELGSKRPQQDWGRNDPSLDGNRGQSDPSNWGRSSPCNRGQSDPSSASKTDGLRARPEPLKTEERQRKDTSSSSSEEEEEERSGLSACAQLYADISQREWSSADPRWFSLTFEGGRYAQVDILDELQRWDLWLQKEGRKRDGGDRDHRFPDDPKGALLRWMQKARSWSTSRPTTDDRADAAAGRFQGRRSPSLKVKRISAASFDGDTHV